MGRFDLGLSLGYSITDSALALGLYYRHIQSIKCLVPSKVQLGQCTVPTLQLPR